MNVSGPSDAVPMPVAVVSLCSTPRAPHLLNQLAALAGHADVERIVVWIDDDDPPSMMRPHSAGRPRTGGAASRHSSQHGCDGGDREGRRADRLPRRRLRAGGGPAGSLPCGGARAPRCRAGRPGHLPATRIGRVRSIRFAARDRAACGATEPAGSHHADGCCRRVSAVLVTVVRDDRGDLAAHRRIP